MLVKLTFSCKKEEEKGRKVGMDVQAEEELLCDAQQAGPNGHDQQTQSTEHMDGEIRGS